MSFSALVPPLLAGILGLTQLPSGGDARAPSDWEIRQAISAIEAADGYRDVVAAIERHGAVLGSPRVVALADALLEDEQLDANRRGLLMLERQLSLDCRQRGNAVAARLLAIRLVAGYALMSDTPQQFAGVLGKFAPLDKEITVQLVRDALDTPGNSWPKGLLPLMEQLARDWPAQGPLVAAMRMSAAANPATPTSPAAPAPGGGSSLAGHWRSTRIIFERPQDEHLVLHPNGVAETWTATASGRSQSMRGRWSSQGSGLTVDWEDGSQWSNPFTFHDGQLVYPSVAGRRKFWDLVQ